MYRPIHYIRLLVEQSRDELLGLRCELASPAYSDAAIFVMIYAIMEYAIRIYWHLVLNLRPKYSGMVATCWNGQMSLPGKFTDAHTDVTTR